MDLTGQYAGLQQPTKGVQLSAPDATKIFLHAGENAVQYSSFINVISGLSQAFKFLPTYAQNVYSGATPTDEALHEFPWEGDEIFGSASKQFDPSNPDKIWGEGVGKAYSNIKFNADASDWDLIEGADTSNSSIIDEINNYFDWDAIKTEGSGKSYYQIAKSGDLTSMSDVEAFNRMASMLESRERVFKPLRDIFGDSTMLTNDAEVVTNLEHWLEGYTDIDPHNMGALKMFFSMQSDFINTLDAYVNHETYWGGDLVNQVPPTDLGTFGVNLREAVDRYVLSLSSNSEMQKAAQHLEDMWFNIKEIGVSVDLTYNAASADYDLGQANITDASEKVYVNGTLMVKGTDYAIDYATGIITFTEGILASDSVIKVDFTHVGQTDQARWDRVGNKWTSELVATETSWVKFFNDAMDECFNQETVRVIICNMLNRSTNTKFKNDKAVYEAKKDDMDQDKIFLEKLAAKQKAAAKRWLKGLGKKSKAANIKPKKAHGARPANRAVKPHKPMGEGYAKGKLMVSMKRDNLAVRAPKGAGAAPKAVGAPSAAAHAKSQQKKVI